MYKLIVKDQNGSLGEMVTLVPPIPVSIGSGWKQPHRTNFNFTDDGYVIARKAVVDELAEYNTTLPTAAYPGKMWKRIEGTVTYLCWYGETLDRDPTLVSIHRRPIILKEMSDLLGMT